MNTSGVYSPYKAAHHLSKLSQLRRGELIWPTQIQIDLTNKCNHRCVYCFYRCARNESLNALFDEKDFIPTVKMISLLEEFNEVGHLSVQYTGGGEPLAHPGIYDILKRTVELGLDYALVTNGSMIDMSKIDLFKNIAWVRVSLDAATDGVYEKSQGAPKEDFHKALEFVKALVAMNKKIVVGLSFVVSPINYKEIVTFTEMAKGLGVANVRFSVSYTPRGTSLYKDIWGEIECLAREAKKLETPDFRIFNLISAHLENLDCKTKGYAFCGYQHFTAVIGADQVVYPCCTLKYNGLSGFGSVKDSSFKNIWHGRRRAKWLEFDHLGKVCDKNPCWMDSKNSFISYLIDNNPAHVNYV